MSNDWTVSELVERYELEPHPEGGYYRETWRSNRIFDEEALPGYPGARAAGTSILYLLPAGEVSQWHRFRSEELWIFQGGNPAVLSMAERRESEPTERRLGPGPDGQLQLHVPGDVWQRTEVLDGPAEGALFACVVVPGFDFEDFEMMESTD